MGSAVSLRSDFDGAKLRLLALASIYDGGSRGDAARLGSVTVQIVRDWGVRFNDRGADGLVTGKAPGKPSLIPVYRRLTLDEWDFNPFSPRREVMTFRFIDQAKKEFPAD